MGSRRFRPTRPTTCPTVTVTTGTLVSNFPPTVQASGNVAEFTVSGGYGYNTVCATGFNCYNPRSMSRYRAREPIDQSVHGNDFWQTDYVPSTGLYKFTYAIPADGGSHHYKVVIPATPVVTDDGAYTFSATSLHATWTSADPPSYILQYEYAIGTSPTDPGSGYLVNWTPTGNAYATQPLSLVPGTTYYFYVKAQVLGGSWTGVGVSDGITCDSSVPSAPVVIDDGVYTSSTTSLHSASWSATDPVSGIIA